MVWVTVSHSFLNQRSTFYSLRLSWVVRFMLCDSVSFNFWLDLDIKVINIITQSFDHLTALMYAKAEDTKQWRPVYVFIRRAPLANCSCRDSCFVFHDLWQKLLQFDKLFQRCQKRQAHHLELHKRMLLCQQMHLQHPDKEKHRVSYCNAYILNDKGLLIVIICAQQTCYHDNQNCKHNDTLRNFEQPAISSEADMISF